MAKGQRRPAPVRGQAGQFTRRASNVAPVSTEPVDTGRNTVEAGIDELASMAPAPKAPDNLGNFKPETDTPPPTRRGRTPQHLPTVEDERELRRATGQREPEPKRGVDEVPDPRELAGGGDVDQGDYDERDDFIPDDRYEREEPPDAERIFGGPEDEEDEAAYRRDRRPAPEHQRQILEQNEYIRRLEAQVAAGRGPAAGGPVAPAAGGAPAPELTREAVVAAVRRLPFSFDAQTCEMLGVRPEAAPMLHEAFARTAEHALSVGIAVAAPEIARLERRVDEMQPVRQAVTQNQLKDAYYRTNADLVGYERESAWHWDEATRAYPNASAKQLIDYVGEQTRAYLASRGIQTRRRRAPARDGFETRGEYQPTAPRRVRPASADFGGSPGGGRLNGSRAPLTAVQRGIAELAGLGRSIH